MGLILGENVGNSLLGYVFGNTTPAGAGAIPASYYAALYTVEPTGIGTGGGGTEVPVGTGAYGRVLVTNNTTNFPAPSGQQVALSLTLNWPALTGLYGAPIVAIGFFDAATAGNFKHAFTLPFPVTFAVGQVPTLTGGFLTAQIAGDA